MFDAWTEVSGTAECNALIVGATNAEKTLVCFDVNELFITVYVLCLWFGIPLLYTHRGEGGHFFVRIDTCT